MAHDLKKKWRSDDVRLQENVDFTHLLLSDRVLFGLKKAGFRKPSPIQLEAIPLCKVGKDVLVQAKSGTGKTLVFVITALEMLRRKLFRPQVMILVPTREIATQIMSVIKLVGCDFPKLTCCSFIGGLSVTDDIENAKTCQIVVGTPGRLKQLVVEKALATNSIRLLVFDEADRLLQMSFKDDINHIFNSLPEDKQVITASATYPEKLKNLLLKYLREPHIACLNSREIALLGIIHYAKVAKSSPMPLIQYKFKLSVLEEILKSVKFSQCLVFCNGIQRVEVLNKEIKEWGFSVAYISSAKEQCDRLKAIDCLKNFKCKVLVSSDVTSRGIDAKNVDLVVNFDLAYGVETYMHRAGRAGRYGSVGVNISIVVEKELMYLKKIEREVSFKTYKLPDHIPVDLIQNKTFGEYIIQESDTEELDSDQESVILEEAKTNISVGNKNNVIEDGSKKNFDKNIAFGTNIDDNDYTLPNQTIVKAEIGIIQPIIEKNDNIINVNLDNSNIECGHQLFESIVDSGKHVDLNNESTKDSEKNGENISMYETDSVLTNKTISENICNASDTVADSPSLNNTDVLQQKSDIISFENTTYPENIEVGNSRFIEDNKRENGNLSDSVVENVPQSFEILVTAVAQADLDSKCMGDEKMENEFENNFLEAKEIEIFDEKLCNSVSQSYELNDIKNCAENIPLDDVFENDIFVSDDLDNLDVVIKTFLKNYESDENKELDILNSNAEDNSASEAISVCAINELSRKKYTYVYEVFKKFQGEKNNYTSSEDFNALPDMSLQDKMCEPDIPYVDANIEGSITTDNQCRSENHMDLVEKSESSRDPPRKGKYEDISLKPVDTHECEFDSTYRIRRVVEEFEKNEKSVIDRANSENLQTTSSSQRNCIDVEHSYAANSTVSEPLGASALEVDPSYRYRLMIQKYSKNCPEPLDFSSDRGKKWLHPLKKLSDSDSADTELSEEVNLDTSQYSSSSEDSEEESTSDLSESSSSSEGSYHHNKFRTGKQNPSLLSSSSCSNNSEEKNKTKCKQNNSLSLKHSQCNSSKSYRSVCCSCCSNDSRHPYGCSNNKVCASACEAHSQCAFLQQHACDRSYFQPSKHRCHHGSIRNQMQLSSHWHKTFYNQWKHLQNCVNSVMM